MMHRPVEHYTSDRLPNKHPFPPDRPEDENSDVDYNVMCDLYYLKRNKEGDAFFDECKRVFITNVKGTFFGMSESEEASKRR